MTDRAPKKRKKTVLDFALGVRQPEDDVAVPVAVVDEIKIAAPPAPTAQPAEMRDGHPVIAVKNVDTKNVEPGWMVVLEDPKNNIVSPVGHVAEADKNLASVDEELSRRLPTSADISGGVAFQMGMIDYVAAPPLPGNPMPRWVSELCIEPPPNRPPLLPVIRVFGCTDTELSVVARVHGYEPYLWCQLPPGWDPARDLPPPKELRRRLDAKARSEVATAVAANQFSGGGEQQWWRKNKRGGTAESPVVVRVEYTTKQPFRGVSEHQFPFVRITTCLPKHVPVVRRLLEHEGSLTDKCPMLECFEADVPFELRFMADHRITGCDWLKVLSDKWVRERHDRGRPLDREMGGYCARRAEAERRIQKFCGGDGVANCNINNEARVCENLGPDWGDPYGEVLEDKQGKCIAPWKDDERRSARPNALPHFDRCGCEESRCSLEFDVDPSGIVSLGTEGEWAKREMSLDTEWIGKGDMFPEQALDPIVCICFSTMTTHDSRPRATYALQLWECAPVPDAAATLWFDDEKTLLMAFRDLFIAYDPDVVTGYNINNFDWPYMFARARALGIEKRFCDFSRVRSEPARLKRGGAGFKSKAAVRDVDEIAIAGRMVYDMYVAILSNGNYKLSSYSLNYVSAYFLGRQKRDVGHDQLPILQRGTVEDRGVLADYCCEDTRLPLLLSVKWVEIATAAEMARTTRVPVDYLLKRGQNVKVSAQVYAVTGPLGIVVNVSKTKEISEVGAKFQGATVLPPVRGYYDVPVATLDFASLYPSIMMAHNLCLSTLMSPEQRARFHPDNFEVTPIGVAFVRAPKQFDGKTLEKLGIAKLEDVGLVRGTHYMCDVDERRPYLKTPGRIALDAARKLNLVEGPDYIPVPDSDPPAVELDCTRRHGILPRILVSLLTRRAEAKKLMAAAKDSAMKAVYNGRQLSLKICSNSVYGITGAQSGRLSLPEIAASVTAYGRGMIELTKNIVETEFGGSVKYGDSVAEYTPVLIMTSKGKIKYVRIKEVVPSHKFLKVESNDPASKEIRLVRKRVCVWTETGFARITRVIRHEYPSGDLVRVHTERGCVDVTRDHSLVLADGKTCVGPEIAAAGKLPLLHLDAFPWCVPRPGTEMPVPYAEVAFARGAFLACGDSFEYSWSMEHRDRALLEHVRAALDGDPASRPLGGFLLKEPCCSDNMYQLYARGDGKTAFARRESDRYGTIYQHLPRVPHEILAAPAVICEAFVRGYCEGRGKEDDAEFRPGKLIRCRVRAQLAAAGMFYLLSKMGYEVCISEIPPSALTAHEAKIPFDYYLLIATMSAGGRMPSRDPVLPRGFPIREKRGEGDSGAAIAYDLAHYALELPSIFGGHKTPTYVYDLETENHHFAAGIGLLVVHNTDSVMVDFMFRLPIGREISIFVRTEDRKRSQMRAAIEASAKGALDNLNTPDAVAAAADRKKKLDAIKNAEGPEAAEKAAKELPPLPPTFSQTKAAALAPALFDAVAADHDAAIARFADSRFAPETFVRRSDPKTLNTREIRVEYNEHVAEYCRTSVDSLRGRLAAQDFSEAIGPDARKDWLAVDSVVAKIQGDVTAATKLAVELDLVYKAADVGKKACAKVTSVLPYPCQLAFEKVLVRWLLINKKRYADRRWIDGVLLDKISSSGLETKRRDSCPLVKSTMSNMLTQLMLKDDVVGAVRAAREPIAKLRGQEFSLDQLIITSGYVRKEVNYVQKQKHTEVVKKMKARDPATAPRLGQRVPFVLIAGHKGAKGFERAEHPLYVLRNGCPVDIDYYINNQLHKPIKRVMRALVSNVKLVFSTNATIDDIMSGTLGQQQQQKIFAAEGKERPPKRAKKISGIVTRVAPASKCPGSIGRFLVITGERCLGCNVSLQLCAEKMAPAVCRACLPDIEDIRRGAEENAKKADAALRAAIEECEECGNVGKFKKSAGDAEKIRSRSTAECENVECPTLYVRSKAAENAKVAARQLARFAVPCPSPSESEISRSTIIASINERKRKKEKKKSATKSGGNGDAGVAAMATLMKSWFGRSAEQKHQ